MHQLLLCCPLCLLCRLFFVSSMFHKHKTDIKDLNFNNSRGAACGGSSVWRKLVVNDVAYQNDGNQHVTEWHLHQTRCTTCLKHWRKQAYNKHEVTT